MMPRHSQYLRQTDVKRLLIEKKTRVLRPADCILVPASSFRRYKEIAWRNLKKPRSTVEEANHEYLLESGWKSSIDPNRTSFTINFEGHWLTDIDAAGKKYGKKIIVRTDRGFFTSLSDTYFGSIQVLNFALMAPRLFNHYVRNRTRLTEELLDTPDIRYEVKADMQFYTREFTGNKNNGGFLYILSLTYPEGSINPKTVGLIYAECPGAIGEAVLLSPKGGSVDFFMDK